MGNIKNGKTAQELERIHGQYWNDGTKLWRYMDVYGFLSLLTTRELKFTRLIDFEDGLEGTMPTLNQATFFANFASERYFTRTNVLERKERLERVRQQT